MNTTLKHATVILPVLALIAGCGRGVLDRVDGGGGTGGSRPRCSLSPSA